MNGDAESELVRSLARRTEAAQANADAMLRVMEEYSLTITARSFPLWRPTRRARGTLAALGEFTILATDGCVAFFERDGEVLLGHVASFDGKVEPLHSASEGTPKAGRKRKESTVSLAMAMLSELSESK